MKQSVALSELEAFANKCIAAERYPDDHHLFTPARCPTCGVVPLELTIEHHTGSKTGDFKGVIFGHCEECNGTDRIFGYTGPHRERVREERPICQCESAYFLVGECERIEGAEGIPGFFDEGVVAGKCADCGQEQAFVYTD